MIPYEYTSASQSLEFPIERGGSHLDTTAKSRRNSGLAGSQGTQSLANGAQVGGIDRQKQHGSERLTVSTACRDKQHRSRDVYLSVVGQVAMHLWRHPLQSADASRQLMVRSLRWGCGAVGSSGSLIEQPGRSFVQLSRPVKRSDSSRSQGAQSAPGQSPRDGGERGPGGSCPLGITAFQIKYELFRPVPRQKDPVIAIAAEPFTPPRLRNSLFSSDKLWSLSHPKVAHRSGKLFTLVRFALS